MKKVFEAQQDFDAFKEHVAISPAPVRFGIWTAFALKRMLGDRLQRVPLLKIVDGSISALIAMHRNGGNEVTVSEAKSCGWDAPEHEMVFDLVVVGSGPGGAITAANESAAGRKVLIIEKGQNLNPAIPHHSPEQMKHFFESGGQEVIISIPPIPFAQGSVFGGGSEINSGLYHRLPNHIRDEWLLATGIDCASWQNHELEVEKTLSIDRQSGSSIGVYERSPIIAAAQHLGWDYDLIPRWRTYSKDGFQHHGMATTYLSSSFKSGAKNLLGHEVVKLKVKKDRVIVTLNGSYCSHTSLAKNVCLAAGTVGTPTILWRSKLAKVRDFSFKFHAMIREVARFDRNVNDLHDIDPHQAWSHTEGVKIGAAVSTPKLLEATLASKGVAANADYQNIGVYYASINSQGANGFVPIGRRLYPFFLPSKTMEAAITRTQSILVQGLESAGGKVLGGKSPSVSTVHIFGSIPLGDNRLIDVNANLVKSAGRVFIRDASLLPSHPTVNPQGPLMHLIQALEEIRLREFN